MGVFTLVGTHQIRWLPSQPKYEKKYSFSHVCTTLRFEHSSSEALKNNQYFVYK